jgi:flagellar basal body-associated protein FliL
MIVMIVMMIVIVIIVIVLKIVDFGNKHTDDNDDEVMNTVYIQHIY